jgi:hypothetical protein
MEVTKLQLLSWSVVVNLLPTLAPEEVDLLPEIIENIHSPSGNIGNQPTAFNAGDIYSMAETIFTIVTAAVSLVLPALGEVSVGIAKDAIKDIIKAARKKSSPDPFNLTEAQLRIIQTSILASAKSHRLSDTTGVNIANAVIAQISMSSLS